MCNPKTGEQDIVGVAVPGRPVVIGLGGLDVTRLSLVRAILLALNRRETVAEAGELAKDAQFTIPSRLKPKTCGHGNDKRGTRL